jgi:hypothetical protein
MTEMSKMLSNISHFVLIVFYSVDCSFAGNVIPVKYKISSFKFCAVSDVFLNKFSDVSLQRCVDECAQRNNCWAVNHLRHFHTCELIPVGKEDALFLSGRKNSACVFVKKTDMYISEVRLMKTFALVHLYHN